MITLRDLAEDWIMARGALKQQIKRLEDDNVFPQANGLSEDTRNDIVARIRRAIAEIDSLLKEFPHA